MEQQQMYKPPGQPENNFGGAQNFYEKNNDLFNQPPARFESKPDHNRYNSMEPYKPTQDIPAGPPSNFEGSFKPL
jgi:hypothetical protein